MKKWNKMKSNIADEELKYKFMNGYNLFYQEDSDKITIIGMKKNLLFYLTSSCSSKDIPMVKTIKTRCNKIVASETLIAEEQQKLEGYKLELKKWQVHKKNLEKLFQEIDNDV